MENFAMKEDERLTNNDQTLLCIIDALGLGYPLRLCVSAEHRSVSPGNDECTHSMLIEHSSCLKISGGLAPEVVVCKISTCLLTNLKTVAPRLVSPPAVSLLAQPQRMMHPRALAVRAKSHRFARPQ